MRALGDSTMSTEPAASRRMFLKTSASFAAGLGTLTALVAPARGADEDQLPTYHGKTISQWIAQLKDVESSARSAAASELRQIGPAAKAALPALTDALKDKHGHVRYEAAAALGKIGPEAEA